MALPLVLMYHGFGARSRSEDPQNLFVPAEAFEAQLTSLLGRGFRPLDQSAFLDGLEDGHWPRRSFLVTMDDGYVSALEVAAPLLARLHVPAVLFALPGLLGGTSWWMPEMPGERLLDREGLRQLPRWGVTVALHGLDHRSLAGSEPVELQRQTAQAKHMLTEVTGATPVLFAYPFGHHDEAARAAVAGAGFSAAFAIYSRGGQFAFPRVDVNALDTARTFAVKTSRAYPHAKAFIDRAPKLRSLAHSLLGRAGR